MSLSASKIEAKYGVSIFGEVISLPLSVLQSQTNQVRKLTQTLSQIRTTIIQKLLGSITDFVSVLFFVPILFFYSPLLGAIVLGFCSISSIYSFIHSRKHKLLVNQTFQADQRRQELLATTVDGFEDIKRLGLEEEIFNQWKNFEGEYIKSNEKSSSSSSSVNEVGTLLNNLLTVIVLFVGVHMVFSGDLSAGVLIGVNMLIGKIYRPTLNLVDLPSDLKKFSDLLGNLKKSAGLSSEDRGSGQYHPIQGGITFQNVAFSFKDNVNVIDNVSINIAPGEIIGICGPSGSGKTILGELVQGLFNPNDGKVFIDGNDIRTFNIQHLRSQISIVGGNQYFFPGSIRENMQRIFPNANNDRILWATKLAKVSEDIEKLEKGYETPLGDSVADISPAMKQKLAIARAIIRNPKILVLDDIFANLDTPNELQIMSGIPDLARGRTLIIISQQLWYLRHCRKIMFMNQGKVEQFGDTQTVISEKGPIQSFLNQQLNIVSPKLEGQQKLIFDQ
jgi:ABC-type bacteriocin/lantibiotic exporter with double-glycine peptidase domain